MKRTIDEIYNIIIEKRQNAINDRYRHLSQEHKELCIELQGEIDAYTDVLILIENSSILKEDNE